MEQQTVGHKRTALRVPAWVHALLCELQLAIEVSRGATAGVSKNEAILLSIRYAHWRLVVNDDVLNEVEMARQITDAIAGKRYIGLDAERYGTK